MSVEAIPGGVRLLLHVQPGASTSEVAGLHGERIKLRIASPPVDGRANAAVVAWLAKCIGLPRGSIRLVRGEHSRQKTVELEGVTVAAVREALGVKR